MSTDRRRGLRRHRPKFVLGNQISLLENGQEYFPALEDALAQARHEVFFETYIFVDDPIGRRIAQALIAAADRGVKVRLVLDGFGADSFNGELARQLRASQVHLRIYRPGRWSFSRKHLRRMHRKLVVIDAAQAFVGGINIMDDFNDPNHGRLEFPRLDFACCARGPIVAQIRAAMQALWLNLRAAQIVGGGVKRFKHRTAETFDAPVTAAQASANQGLPAMFVQRDNFRFRRTIERQYLSAIAAAKHRILIANAYFFPGMRFRRALTAAAARGVQVTLLLQGKVEYAVQHYASQALYDELLLAGVQIFEYERSFLHAKVAVMDDWSTVGSSNIDPFSLLLAREANLIVQDAGFAADLHQRLQKIIASGAQAVRASHHLKRPWPIRLLNHLSFAVLRLGVVLSGAASRF